ncbi:MAG: putative phage abortive infection protein [Bacteroidota bacterium]
MSKGKSPLQKYFVIFLGFATFMSILVGFAIIYFVFTEIKGLETTDVLDLNKLSLIGEFFGGAVGPIWSLAGVILFYLALIYQRRELELQREELVETRYIMDNQSKTIEIQQFENTFFQLLEFHLDAAKRIENHATGNGFDKMYQDFQKGVTATKRKRKKDGSSSVLDEEAFETSFRQVYDSYRNSLSHYMESYKSLLFFVNNKSKDPAFYINIIKPHLTEQEVLIQFYWLVTYDKDPKFIKIVEKYTLFERLNFRSVQAVDRLHLEELNESAYKPAHKIKKKESEEEKDKEQDTED